MYIMKKYLSWISMILIISSCTPESDPIEIEKKSIKVDLHASSLTLEVDEMATVTIDSDTPLKEVAWIAEDFTKTRTAMTGESLPADMELFFQFPNPGIYLIPLKFTGTNGETVRKQLQFEVIRGNTVQITGINVNNFFGKGESWDPEFSEDDPQRLADLILALEKIHQTDFTKKEYSKGTWYISEVHENESSLSWDLSEEQLFLNPLFGFHLGLGDVDEGNIGQNLLVNLPSYFIDLRIEMENKPESVSLIDESVDLDITIFLDWK